MSPIALPDIDTIVRVSKQTVYDASGNEIKFGNLYNDQEAIVVFIRHFFCGNCQAYVTQLASVRPEALERANKTLIVIGCGDHKPIKAYCETTGYQGQIYTNPSRSLYRLLKLTEKLQRTPTGKRKKDYLGGTSFFRNLISSIWSGPLKNPRLIGKQGNIAQLGGEFFFGPGDQCSFASRMEHTEDHVDVAELMQEAGVEYP